MEKELNKKGIQQEIEKSDVAKKEEEVLAFWRENKVFEKLLTKDAPNGNFVFYDGPPFATGLPHFGHLLPSSIKDAIPRYQTMRGKRVLRRWGWDCHGLPIENMIEKELGLGTKKDIETYGIGKFNDAARASVFRYADAWKKVIPRVGRWVDMDHDYRTMDASYTESVWWSFKTLYDKKLIYQGFKVMPVCPRCETTLSNFEVNQGYKDITDISVYVKFELVDEPGTYLLAWTTTPWTLPGNMALAVGDDIEYVKVRCVKKLPLTLTPLDVQSPEGNKMVIEHFVFAKKQTEHLKSFFDGVYAKYEVVAKLKGSDLVGKRYTPVFSEMKTWLESTKLQAEQAKNTEHAWRVYAGDFVTTDTGTGIVHIAPMYGEDDYNLAKTYDLPTWHHVGMDGVFKSEFVPESLKTLYAKPKDVEKDSHQSTDIEIIKYLAHIGALFAKEKIVHSYPHCWRCDTPLLNYATSSWFVRVTDIKDTMMTLNQKVKWVPKEIGDGRFGKWLEGARDWAISRSRYWGAPLPVWYDAEGNYRVIGSVDELKKSTKNRGNHFIFVRHGEAENNVNSVVSCQKDDGLSLSDLGRQQITNLGKTFAGKKVDAVYCSPYKRTEETAEMLVEVLGVDKEKVTVDNRLEEFNFGDFDGKPFQEFLQYEAEHMPAYDVPTPHGESYLDAKKRFGQFLYEIDARHMHETIMVVTHGIGLEVIQAVIQGADAVESKKIVDEYTPAPGSAIEFDFVPLPHNENYELDLHRPFIDEIEVMSEKGVIMKRVPEVFDTWYDSGSMPFAQAHYPFENKDLFEQKNSPLFPANFIAEGLDQTRGWFYTLLVLGTALFEKSPYDNVMVNGLVLAEDGRKMSKSLKNYPDLMKTVDKFGADAIRYFLLSSPVVKAEDSSFSERGVDEVYKKIILKLNNIVSFYELYAGDSSQTVNLKGNVLDLWIQNRLLELCNTITDSMDKYELDRATRPILAFVDDFSTWYVRRSRDRFKSDNESEKNAAIGTTAYVLLNLSKLIAPFMPFIAEEVYQKVKSVDVGGGVESVHLCDWPKGGEVDTELLSDMQRARDTVTQVLEARSQKGIKVRQPLASLVVREDLSMDLRTILAEEVNVKEVISDASMAVPFELDTEVTPELQNEGNARDLIRAIQETRKTANMTPSQSITVTVETDAIGREFVEQNREMLSKPTNVSEFVFGENGGVELVVEHMKFKIAIQ